MSQVDWDADRGLITAATSGQRILLPPLWGMTPAPDGPDRLVMRGGGLTVAVHLLADAVRLEGAYDGGC